MTGFVYLDTAGSRPVRIGKLLGEGAAGRVHALPELRGTAAKLYHGDADCRRHAAKIDWMLANPPDLPPALHGGLRYPQIAWPQAKLFDRAGRFVGFTMPEIDFARSTSLVNLLQKSSRRIEHLPEYYGYRVLVARNLASVFAELHRAGHHMIDMKPANLRFYPLVSWMAVVDTDGFSIAGGAGGRIPADQVSDDYIAPESWQQKPEQLGVEQDRFALAVIVFQLLNNGVHPFSGALAPGAAGQATHLQARIQSGLYGYGLVPDARVQPAAASVHRMFRRSTREMFDRVFAGRDPRARPTAEQWRDHLEELVERLTPCAARPDMHAHFGQGCGFCGHEGRVAAAVQKAVLEARRTPARMVPPLARPARRPIPVRGRPYAGAVHAAFPPRARRRRSAMWKAIPALAILGGFLLPSEQLWEQARWLRDRMAPRIQAVAAVTPQPVDAAGVTLFPEPRDYLVLPRKGDVSVAMREGPGTEFSEVEALPMHEQVAGRGESSGADGARWLWVMRTADGKSGFVPEAALLDRTAGKRPGRAGCDAIVSPGAAAACIVGSELAGEEVEKRYQGLLGRAAGYDRIRLTEGQQLWRDQRARCTADYDPVACTAQVDARRLGDLSSWSRAIAIANDGVATGVAGVDAGADAGADALLR